MAAETTIIKCQNCAAPVTVSDELCAQCGAKLLHRSVLLGAPKLEVFSLTGEEKQPADEFTTDDPQWQFPPKFSAASSPPQPATEAEATPIVRAGGFFRRLFALVVDLLVLTLLSAIMGVMAYVGYKVGLAAHGQAIGRDNASALVAILILAWLGLTTTYFVTLHGLGGQTLGKRIFRLRVVGAERKPLNLRQAAIRWFATVGLAPFGIGFLWILWQREKRGWHDFVARTWVVRE